ETCLPMAPFSLLHQRAAQVNAMNARARCDVIQFRKALFTTVCPRSVIVAAQPQPLASRYIEMQLPRMEITSCHGAVVLNRDGAGGWKFRESVRASTPWRLSRHPR